MKSRNKKVIYASVLIAILMIRYSELIGMIQQGSAINKIERIATIGRSTGLIDKYMFTNTVQQDMLSTKINEITKIVSIKKNTWSINRCISCIKKVLFLSAILYLLKNLGMEVESSNRGMIKETIFLNNSYIEIGYIVIDGKGRDGLITKYNQYDRQLWEKTFGGKQDEEFDSIIATKERGYIVRGTSKIRGGILQSAILVKFASKGTLLWNATIGGGHGRAWFQLVEEAEDKTITAVGFVRNVNRTDLLIVKYTSEGKEIWYSVALKPNNEGTGTYRYKGLIIDGTKVTKWGDGNKTSAIMVVHKGEDSKRFFQEILDVRILLNLSIKNTQKKLESWLQSNESTFFKEKDKNEL